jgi:hypothetical protein
MSQIEEELMAKRAIKQAEKEHLENLDRAREISQVASELQNGIKKRQALTHDDLKRLDRLEKLTKKVRSEAGGEDDDVKIEKQPGDLAGTISQIGQTARSLSEAVQNTPRQVISASVIDSANVLLELIKMARAFMQ